MSTALITGASGGIGKAYAEELAARKTNLILVARSEEKLNQLAKQLQEKYQVQVDVIVQDLTETGAPAAVFDTVKNKGLTVDMLINNAGFGDYGDFAERDEERQTKMVQLNVLTVVELTHKFLPLMRQRGAGDIINVASIAAFQPIPYISVYAASKAFILSFSQAQWAENRKYGIRVLCVCPGPVETNFFDEAKFPPTLAAKSNKIAPVEEVVQDTFKALQRGDSVVVSGGMASKFISNFSRIVPRKTLVNILEQQFRG